MSDSAPSVRMSGAASRNRGRDSEQRVAKWFREHGFPNSERVVRTGYRTADRESPDGADVLLTAGVVAQVKSLRPVSRLERAVPGWLAETEAQRVAAGAEVALLVVRRDGTADVGEWWAWLDLHTLGELLTTSSLLMAQPPTLNAPVRLLVRDACVLLRERGYGEPLLAEPVDLPSAEDVRGILRPEWVESQ